MSARTAWARSTRAGAALVLSGAMVTSAAGAGCKKKATTEQCDALIGRYAELVVKQQHPDAPPDEIARELARERDEARGDDDFKSCTAEVTVEEHACAMGAKTVEAFEKCLE